MSLAAEAAIASLEAAGLASITLKPGHDDYETRANSSWSRTVRCRPWAIVQPRSTNDVCAAVKAIVATPNCNFAIRSGGHSPWPGAASINQGILIDLGQMVGTTYHAHTQIASILPGGTWTQVYTELEKHGRLVAGGREGHIGVGGLVLGGGLGFQTCRVGFTCDQVVNFVLVDSTGTALDVNASSHPDLFRALKGGGNNFGIVTRFDMATFAAPPAFLHGSVTFALHAAPHLAKAYVNYVSCLNHRPDSHVLVAWETRPNQDCLIRLMVFGLDGIKDHPDLLPLINCPGAHTDLQLSTVATNVGQFLMPSDKENIWFSATFRANPQVILHAARIYPPLLALIKSHVPSGDFFSLLTFQPLPASFAQRSHQNVIGIDAADGDCILLALVLQVASPSLCNDIVIPAAKALVANLEDFARSLDAFVPWRYANYCSPHQDPAASFGARNLSFVRHVAARYDPQAIFQNRVPGGFKIPPPQ
ncbi:hypothetical protein CDD81_3401 [Ophiocordyceps australis]|uniref:FAD-binding PCMH-type domain-containing protein n=1 Tax=Ophiocordyceps australis TaxID=1399860 RepID=A0A2C5X789_9HYPO|nr:hypothetical protein CDD81_3401 [Ophiocordyceps australis]